MRGAFAQGSPSAPRRRVEVDGQRVSVIDVHCHCVVPEALNVLKGTAMEAQFATTLKSAFNNPSLEKRIAAMDAQGIDIEAMRTGGVSGMFFGIDRARFVTRRLLGGPRQVDMVSAVSPAIEYKLLYLASGGRVVPIKAGADVPSRAASVGTALDVRQGRWVDSPADSAWIAPTAQQLYDELDHFHLPVVEPFDGLQLCFHLACLVRFPLNVLVEFVHGVAHHFSLGQEKVGEVVVVRLRIQKRASVFHGCLAQNRRYGDELEQPVSGVQHRPVKQGPGGSPVAVYKGMVIGQPEVQKDCSDRGMNETV
jgi:hypothetical protein